MPDREYGTAKKKNFSKLGEHAKLALCREGSATSDECRSLLQQKFTAALVEQTFADEFLPAIGRDADVLNFFDQ